MGELMFNFFKLLKSFNLALTVSGEVFLGKGKEGLKP